MYYLCFLILKHFYNYKSHFPKTFTAKLCGMFNPAPIFSPGNVMVIHFKSDGENNFRGFKARFTFLPSGQYKHLCNSDFCS